MHNALPGRAIPRATKPDGRSSGVALQAFGEDGFTAVSTRRIAQASGITLPVLQYHFGSKEGLYRACAEAFVERDAEHTTDPAAAAVAALVAGCDADSARTHLKAVIAVAVVLVD
jgi:TetR/AcrR family transcriptional regulator, regulator of cefoperazone and chloramphenicol sensitivity